MRLDVRLEAFEEPIGTLESEISGAVRFQYNTDYISDPRAIPISLAMPLEQRNFDDASSRAFFDNLLPENSQLQVIMERERIARDDIVGLLKWLGADCPGAISCLTQGSEPQKVPGLIAHDYEELSTNDLTEIVHRLSRKEPPLGTKGDPSPLAGVQRKIALTFLGDNRFGLPRAGSKAPTTHIIKVPSKMQARDAELENAAMRIANYALDVKSAVTGILEFDGISAIISERFDRIIGDGQIRRVHQEDFAQALSLPASMKYERQGNGERTFRNSNIARMLSSTSSPAVAKRQFLLTTIFNFAIGNTDNHAKNHALIYDTGAAPRFAPLYDLLPILLDPNVIHDLSLRIGQAELGEQVTKEDFSELMATFGITRSAQARFIKRDIAKMLSKIDEISEPLTSLGMKDFDDLIGRQMERIIEITGLNLRLRKRDYFTVRAGGWGWGS